MKITFNGKSYVSTKSIPTIISVFNNINIYVESNISEILSWFSVCNNENDELNNLFVCHHAAVICSWWSISKIVVDVSTYVRTDPRRNLSSSWISCQQDRGCWRSCRVTEMTDIRSRIHIHRELDSLSLSLPCCGSVVLY